MSVTRPEAQLWKACVLRWRRKSKRFVNNSTRYYNYELYVTTLFGPNSY